MMNELRNNIWLIGLSIAFLIFLWAYQRYQKHKKFSEKNRRNSDRQLSTQEQAAFTEIKKLIAEGKMSQAARTLEVMGFSREAISVFEKAGLIDEACKILQRLGKHERAGAMFKKNKMYAKAIAAFQYSGSDEEIAYCAEQDGQFALAAAHYEKVGALENAMVCYEKSGNLAKIISMLLKLENWEMFFQRCENIPSSQYDAVLHYFDQTVIEKISKSICEQGKWSSFLLRAVADFEQMPQLIVKFAASHHSTELLANLYRDQSLDISKEIVAVFDGTEADCQKVSEVLLANNQAESAGMLLEKMSLYSAAAKAFTRANMPQRAAYCRQRTGESEIEEPAAKAKNVSLSLNFDEASATGKPLPMASLELDFEEDTVITSIPKIHQISAPQLNQQDFFSIFQSNYLLKNLSTNQQQHFWELGTIKELNINDTFMIDKPDGLYTLLVGKVISSSNHNRQEFSSGDVLTEMPLFSGSHNTCQYEVAEPTLIHVIPEEKLTKYFHQQGQITHSVYQALTQKLLKMSA